MEERIVNGKINFIGKIAHLGKLKSIGLRLENQDEWFNIVDFSEARVKEILGNTKIGDEVELKLEKRGEYWNVTNIRHKEEVKGEIQQPIQEFEETGITPKEFEFIEQCAKDAVYITEELEKKQIYVNLNTIFEYLLNHRR